MKSVNELVATERLLDRIRDGLTNRPGAGVSLKKIPSRRFSLPLKGVFAFRGKTVVGVDIGYNDLKLIKVSQYSNRENKILAQCKIPLEQEISFESLQFRQLLKSALARVINRRGSIDVWATIPSHRIEKRYVIIPKVSPNKIADTVYWKCKKEAPFDDRHVIFNLDALGDVDENGKQKIAVMVFIAPREDIEDLRGLFTEIGFPLKGITIAPLAFQNLLRSRLLDPSDETVGVLDIGMVKSRIDIFFQGNLVLSRDIKTSINSMIEAVAQELASDTGTKDLFSLMEDDEVDSQAQDVPIDPAIRQMARGIFFRYIQGSPVSEADERIDVLSQDNFLRIISPVLDRLVWQMEVTARHHTVATQTKELGEILITGDLSGFDPIIRYFGNKLETPAEMVDPFALDQPLGLDIPVPNFAFERAQITSGLGIALSNNTITPNFMFTHKDRTRHKITRRINSIAYAVFFLVLVSFVGISFWQRQLIVQKKMQLANLKLTVDKTSVNINKNQILKKVAQYKNQNKRLRLLSERYLGLGVISELFTLMPPSIRLISLVADFSNGPAKRAERKNYTVVLDGIVSGNRHRLEARLAEFMLRLIDSPIIETSRIEKSSVEYLKEQAVLRFLARLEVVDRKKI